MLSRMKSVVKSPILVTVNIPSLFDPEPKKLDCTQACRSDKGWRFFPLYGCGKNTTAWPIAWTGYVRPVTINQAMGGPIACFCSDPIPPVAVVTDLPAEHVLSRSAGVDEIKQHYHGYCLSSFPIRSMQVLWLQRKRLRFVSFLDESAGSIFYAAEHLLCLHTL